VTRYAVARRRSSASWPGVNGYSHTTPGRRCSACRRCNAACPCVNVSDRCSLSHLSNILRCRSLPMRSGSIWSVSSSRTLSSRLLVSAWIRGNKFWVIADFSRSLAVGPWSKHIDSTIARKPYSLNNRLMEVVRREATRRGRGSKRSEAETRPTNRVETEGLLSQNADSVFSRSALLRQTRPGKSSR
jgi:hypothetical protein